MDEASSYVEGVIGRLLMNECLLVTYHVLFAIAWRPCIAALLALCLVCLSCQGTIYMQTNSFVNLSGCMYPGNSIRMSKLAFRFVLRLDSDIITDIITDNITFIYIVGWQLLLGVWDPLHTHIHILIRLDMIAIIGTSDWPRLAKACKLFLSEKDD